MDFDAPAAIITNVIPTDSSYFIAGIIVDSLPPYRVGNIFGKLGLDGNTIFRKKLTSSTQTYATWENTLQKYNENQFIISGMSSRVDTVAVFSLIFDRFGNILGYNELYHIDSTSAPIFDDDFIVANEQNDRIHLTQIENNDQADYYVIKTDSLGIVKWDYLFGDNNWDIPMSLIIEETTGNIIVGGLKTDQNFTNQDYDFQTHIFALDSLGNELWTYLSPISEGLRDGARDMILLADGSLIVASGIGYEQERASVNVVYFEKSVFKLNVNQEVEWEVSFPEDTLTSRAKTTNLINTSNNSGFLVAGVDVDTDWETYFQQLGWLAKLSYDGDSIWTRRYKYLDTNKSDHEFFDIKETIDGGFILCGESRDREAGAEIPQQAWLLKLDQYGCLIPGCHLIDDVTETETVSYELKLYPNPTSDYLNIFMRHHRGSRNFTFRILNGIGQEMAVFEQNIQEETLMIDLGGYGRGVYYLEVSQEGRILETERFVVQ